LWPGVNLERFFIGLGAREEAMELIKKDIDEFLNHHGIEAYLMFGRFDKNSRVTKEGNHVYCVLGKDTNGGADAALGSRVAMLNRLEGYLELYKKEYENRRLKRR
jgi:hypothetical protein